MSIIYCERHDLRWDSDYKERCPGCEVDNMDIVSDLVAALEMSLDWLASYPGFGSEHAYNRARAALAKSKGE